MQPSITFFSGFALNDLWFLGEAALRTLWISVERVTHLRGNPEMALDERADKESGLSRSIGRLFAIAEDYPDLKASAGFAQLHDSLVRIEEHLQFARRYYNGSVRDNNNLVEGFPSMVIAKAFGFTGAKFFEIELASQRAAPEIKLGQS